MIDGVEFWITIDNGKTRIRLPINPPTLEIESPFGHTEVEVARLGEVIIPGNRGLATYSFETFFPAERNAVYTNYGSALSPLGFIENIERWRDSKEPARFTVTGTHINSEVRLVDFNYDVERAGSPGDIYFSMTLKENRYEEPRTEKLSKPKPKKKKRPPKPKPKPPKTYTVKKGDSLWAIAKRQYGKGSDWPKIYNNAKNKKLIGKNPNLIHPGQKLVIP